MLKRSEQKILNKLRSTRAFTLAEALVAVIILLLVTGIVAGGIPAAMRTYDNVVVASNAEVLLSTAMGTLRNELSTARKIEISKDGKAINYFNESAGAYSMIYLGTPDKNQIRDIMYQRYAPDADGLIISDTDTDAVATADKLVSDAASDNKYKLHVTYTKVTHPKKGVVTFENLGVVRKDVNKTIANRETYSIRIIGDDKTDE